MGSAEHHPAECLECSSPRVAAIEVDEELMAFIRGSAFYACGSSCSGTDCHWIFAEACPVISELRSRVDFLMEKNAVLEQEKSLLVRGVVSHSSRPSGGSVL